MSKRMAINSVQSFFLITVLLITALLALTVLLIVVTEQPDSMIEGRHRKVQLQERGEKQLKGEVSSASDKDSQHHSSIASVTTTVLPPLFSSSQFPMDFALEKVAQFGPSDGGKFMGIQLLGDYLYLPKDDGRIEVRDSHRLVLIRTVSTGIRIHRLRAVNERIFVILDNTFGRLILFDASSGTVLRKRNLEEPAKELTLDEAMVANNTPSPFVRPFSVHTLSRFGTHIASFELDDLRSVTRNSSSSPMDTDQNNCNFIAGDGTGALFVSCGSTITKMTTKGTVLQCFTPPVGVNYSAFLISRSGKLLILNKAQRIVYLVDQDANVPIARLHHYDGTGSSTSLWIWTNFALDQQNGTLLILEYISNRVEVFKMPSDVLHLL